MKMKKETKIKLHKDMLVRMKALAELLDTVEPGETPDDDMIFLCCRDVQVTAKYLRKSFRT